MSRAFFRLWAWKERCETMAHDSGMSMPQQIEAAVSRAMAEGQTPGAVVLVGRGAEVLYHEAFGDRMLAPERRPMLPDTIFDCASVTKSVATATAFMQLLELGS
jgi:CubicO group peptidase (beta-lactamase class C family)